MTAKHKPNIIIFDPDQMRADALHHLGNEAAYTPNMDALAAEGVSFSNAFCQNPVCVPSRCSFMTGLYPHVHGHRTMNYLLHSGEDNLFLDLKKQGYYTMSTTRGDLLAGDDQAYHAQCIDKYIRLQPTKDRVIKHTAFDRGDPDSDTFYSFYHGIIPTEEADAISVNMDDLTVDGVIREIRSRPLDRPFFSFVGLVNPHPPYAIEQKYYDRINKSKLAPRKPTICDEDHKASMETGLRDSLRIFSWSEERLNEIRTVYLAMCAKIDDQLGRLINALKEEGIYDDTVILVFSDHGDYTTDYGIVEKAQNCFPDCLVNIPLIIKPQKGIAMEMGVNDNLAELTDVCATCADLAGFSLDREQFGKSLLPMLRDKSVELHSCVFAEGGRLECETQAMEYDSKTFHAASEYAPRELLQRKIPEHTKATMIRTRKYKYVRRLYEDDEFYDLSIGESQNLIHAPAYAATILLLKEQMLTWYQSSCDIVPQKIDARFDEEFLFNNMRSKGATEQQIFTLKKRMEQAGKTAADIVSEMLEKAGASQTPKEVFTCQDGKRNK